jgi:uncharacterized protein YjaG (DUF416 family)
MSVKELITCCEDAAPESGKYDSLFVSAAQDASFAVCSLLDFLIEKDTRKIVQVATFATDTVDLYIQEDENISSDDPELEMKILCHHLMQRELCRQERGLAILEQESDLNRDLLNALKKSCGSNGGGNLGLTQGQ